MQNAIFKCNALIKERNPASGSNIVDKNAERFGDWIGGAVILRGDSLVFSTNTTNEMLQEETSDFVVPYDGIDSCRLGRMMMLAKTVDLETSFGQLRFRCTGSENDKLLAELQRRIRHLAEVEASIVDQLKTLADVPVSDSIPEISAVLAGQRLRVGIAEDPEEPADAAEGPEIEFLVGKDASGASWLYLYTSEEAMIRGGLAGKSCVTMGFEELFEIAHQQGFGGFILDAWDEDCVALVPAEYFDEMNAALLASRH